MRRSCVSNREDGAGNETRTRDPDLQRRLNCVPHDIQSHPVATTLGCHVCPLCTLLALDRFDVFGRRQLHVVARRWVALAVKSSDMRVAAISSAPQAGVLILLATIKRTQAA